MTLDLWAFRTDVRTEGVDLRGMAVQAPDGGIGKVQDVLERESRTSLLVDTGAWIFGKTIKLPAGLVAGVDPEQGIVLVDRPKDDIKNAPEPDGDPAEDTAHDDALARHYAGGPDEAGPVAAASAPAEPRGATSVGGIAGPADAGAAEAGPGLEDSAADRDDERAAVPVPPLDLGTPEASAATRAGGGATSQPNPAERAGDSGAASGPAPSERAGDSAPTAGAAAPQPDEGTVPTPPRPGVPPSSAPETDPAERAGTGKAPEPKATTAPSEPSADDAPAPLSGLVAPSDGGPEQPPPTDEPASKRPRRRASAPSRGRAAEQPDGAPARKRAETPSRAEPARKRAEAPSRAESADDDKQTKGRERGESATAPAKRQARSGASARNDQPLARYDALTAAEVVGRLRALTQSELAKVERYEKRGDGRQTILKRVASLREKEPWRGYDTATVKEVRERLASAKADRVTAVRDYERRHRNRTGVMEAARRRLDSM